jgi:nitrogen PTS system EIIA component
MEPSMQLTVNEAARLLQVPEKDVLRWIKKDGLPACKINEVLRINRVDLMEWATEHRVQLSPEIFDRLETPDRTLPKISTALECGGIHYDVAGDDLQTVLRNIVALIKLPPEMDADFLLQVLLAREALGTTAIGDGIAIPHVRNPILLHDVMPCITLTFLARPIDFNAIDGKPVTVLFTLITPTVRTHLHTLSRLAYLLRDERLKSVLHRVAPAEEILRTIRSIEAEFNL